MADGPNLSDWVLIDARAGRLPSASGPIRSRSGHLSEMRILQADVIFLNGRGYSRGSRHVACSFRHANRSVFRASRGVLSRRRRSSRSRFHLGVEPLEGRELLATVTVQVANFSFTPSRQHSGGRHGPLGMGIGKSQHDFGGGDRGVVGFRQPQLHSKFLVRPHLHACGNVPVLLQHPRVRQR